jgi:Ice-binding-like/Collagen triple helix repeat (20 copies)
MTMTSGLSKMATVFLALSLGGACGSLKLVAPDAGTAGTTTGGAGDAGSAGTAGAVATAGTIGTAGATGTAGHLGTAGATGTAGHLGTAGVTGSAGIAGIAGVTGAAGIAGTAGIVGTAGHAGADGGVTLPMIHPVNLGKAGDYVILAKTGISTVPDSVITGNLGVSPIASTAVTGFSLITDSTNVFSRSPQVTGKVYAANYATPTPSNLTTAIGDMQTAFTDAAARSPGVTELGAGNIGGMTLLPGVYKWGTGVVIPTNVTLIGSATDVWIFQIAQTLTMSSGAKVLLAGAALPKNVFWQVAGLVDLGTMAHLEGVVLTQTSIALGTGASVKGRLLAQTAVTLQISTIGEPAP